MHGTAFPVHPAGAVDAGLKRQHAQIIEVNLRPRAGDFHIAQPVNRRPGGDVIRHQRIGGVFIQPQGHRSVIAQPAVVDDPLIILQPQRQRAAHRAGHGELFHLDGAGQFAAGDMLQADQRRVALRHTQLQQRQFPA